jgi:hypothetical protein
MYKLISSSEALLAAERALAAVSNRRAQVPEQIESNPKLQTHTTSPTGKPVGIFVL